MIYSVRSSALTREPRLFFVGSIVVSAASVMLGGPWISVLAVRDALFGTGSYYIITS